MLEAIFGMGLIAFAGYTYYSQKNDKSNGIHNYKELKSLIGNGIKCSENVRLSVKQSNEHILMIAPSGWGKSRAFIMQNIDRDPLDGSIIVTDPSGEIEKECITNKKKYVFNPFDKNSVGYDPLVNCKNEFEVRKIASVILLNGMNQLDTTGNNKQLEWINMGKPLLASYMLMNYNTKRYRFDEMIKNLCTLPIISDVVRDELGNVIKATNSIEYEILSSRVESAITEFKAFKQGLEARQTLSSIRTVLNSCLQLFFDNSFKHLFSNQSMDILNIRKEESVLYIQVPERHSTYFSPLVATLLTQMFDAFLENEGKQVYMMFDEMANIGVIPDFSKLLSTARKRNVSIVGALQLTNQLNEVYGEIKGSTLIELFKTVLVCCGLKDSAKYISDMMGVVKTIRDDQEITEPLMTPDEIRLMNENEVLIICNNKRPVIDNKMSNVSNKSS